MEDALPLASVAENDSALSVAAGLAKEAALLFQAGKYVDCLRILNQLSQKKERDPKILHNIAVVENIQDGCPNPKRLLQAIENIKKQNEELACASREHLEVGRQTGSKDTTASMRGNNNVVHQVSGSPVVRGDEFDISVAMFNTAVVWFHLHEYPKSFSCLDALYQNIEPVDEGTALRICLLLLDVALLSQHALRSADVISYIEKVFCVSSLNNQGDNGLSAQQQPFSASKSASIPSNSTISDAFHSDSADASNALENSLIGTLSEEALEDESLQLLSSLDISGRNLQRPGIPLSNDLLRSQAVESLPAVDLRLKLYLYKVRFLLLTRNLKAAKREVKMAMNIARGKDYVMALYLKSQLEYARGNHRKAIKLLLASNNHSETGTSNMYFNNLGCIYYRLGKHHTSGLFFSKALNNSLLVRKEKPPKLVTLSQDKSLLITYNCGVCSLTCGRPFHAARCFQTASLIFYNQPLLWLRIAECCLMALEKGLIKSSHYSNDRSDIRVNVIGKGKWRQLALGYRVSSDDQLEFIGKDDLFPSDGRQPDLSLSLARQCLVNSMHLLDSMGSKSSRFGRVPSSEESESIETSPLQSTNNKNSTDSDPKASNLSSLTSQVNSNGEVKEQRVGNNLIMSLQNSIPEYNDFCMKENRMIKQAVLADLAYVELGLGNPLKALSTAKSLLRLPECSRIYVFLGLMYVAEALCLINKVKEAADYLMMYVSAANNVELPYSQEDCEKLTMEKELDNEDSNGLSGAPNTGSSGSDSKLSVFASPEEARGIYCANFAVSCVLLGDLERAQHFVMKALSEIPNATQAIVTAIYVDLNCGKTQEALARLKQHRGIRFLPGGLKLNGFS
ncbi:uncharacterized protein LOC142552008 [Primulina tabacum]|uniref:uncharacterized protein LOC142552008 n=1 Tax=Primulina tabacum TaxID=48773 RepID=UPI003F5A06FC